MLSNTLLRTIQRFNLFLPGETPVIAVSGGADSVALLLLLTSLQAELEITLHVATFDHMLREESHEDITWVEQLAARLSLPVTVGMADVRLLARERSIGIEAAARQARYKFLADAARQIGANRVVTAHHADDQAETVLMHLLRGAGMQGLQGMRYKSPLPGAPDLLLIRPLLDVSHAALVQYCHDHNIVPRVDVSNFDPSYLRNRIRLEILPKLREINPNLTQSLTRIAEITRSDHDFLDGVVQDFLKENGQFYADYAVINRAAFDRLQPALQRRCIYTCVKQFLHDQGPSFDHILHAVELATEGKVGAVAQFPEKVQLRVDYEVLIVERSDSATVPDEALALLSPGQQLVFDVPGQHVIPKQNWSFVTTYDADGKPDAVVSCPSDNRIVLRGRLPGDRFRPLGMHGKHQTIKEWMINRKIPRNLRSRVPLLVMDDEIAAVIYGKYWAISERFAVRDSTQCTLKLFVNFS